MLSKDLQPRKLSRNKKKFLSIEYGVPWQVSMPILKTTYFSVAYTGIKDASKVRNTCKGGGVSCLEIVFTDNCLISCVRSLVYESNWTGIQTYIISY